MSNTRNSVIDIAKALGIVAVVLGHNPLAQSSRGELYRVIFSFHMPLFFFLAGIFFRPQQPLKLLLQTKTHQLLLPYVLTALTLGSLKVIAGNLSFSAMLAGILYASQHSTPIVSLWFLPHLWLVIIALRVLPHRLTSTTPKKALLGCLAVSILLSGGLFVLKFEHLQHYLQAGISGAGGIWQLCKGVPLSLDLFPLSASFFLCGYLLSESILKFKVTVRLLAPVAAGFILLHFGFNYSLDLYDRTYDNIFISTILAALGICLTLCIASALSKLPLTKKYLPIVGKQSLALVLFHGTLQSLGFQGLLKLTENVLLSSWLAFGIAATLPVGIGVGIDKITQKLAEASTAQRLLANSQP